MLPHSSWMGTKSVLPVPRLAMIRPATATHVYDAEGAEIATWAVEQRVELRVPIQQRGQVGHGPERDPGDG